MSIMVLVRWLLILRVPALQPLLCPSITSLAGLEKIFLVCTCHALIKTPDYPRLARYAGVQGKNLSLTEARMIFRTKKSVIHRPISVVGDRDRFLPDDEKLPDVLFGLHAFCSLACASW